MIRSSGRRCESRSTGLVGWVEPRIAALRRPSSIVRLAGPWRIYQRYPPETPTLVICIAAALAIISSQ